MTFQGWLDSGDWRQVNNYRVFYKDSGGNKPVLCLLHGFPTSSFDYHKVWPLLSQHFRVVIHDHLGFGASDKPENYSYSFIEQTDMALALWKQLGIKECYIAAHDYGTSIATELMARHQLSQLNISISGFVLSNGSVHIELAKLRFVQRLLRSRLFGPIVARLLGYSSFKSNMKNIFFDAQKLDAEELKIHWELIQRESGRTVLPKVSRYTYERQTFWHRWISALSQTELPVDLLWARNDPVAVAEIATTLQKEARHCRLKWIEECGHFPMIEKPEEWAEGLIQQIEVRRQLKS